MSDSTLFYAVAAWCGAVVMAILMAFAERYPNGLASTADRVFRLRGRR